MNASPRWWARAWALLLSLLVPGLGQAVAGNYRRGVSFIVAAFGLGAIADLAAYAVPTSNMHVVAFVLMSSLGASILVSLAAGIDAFRRGSWHRRRRFAAWRRWLVYVAFVAVLALPFDSLVGSRDWKTYSIPSGSMEPTLLPGDYVWAIEGYYSGGRVPAQGDVALFTMAADPSVTFVKRVIGVPGDRVAVREGILVIDDVPVPRDRLASAGDDAPRYREHLPSGAIDEVRLMNEAAPLENTAEFDVPAGRYFVMGDNRDDSDDSRMPGGGVGFVPAENFHARAAMVYFSTDGSARWWQFWKWPGAVRWRRIGLSLGGESGDAVER